MIPLISPFLVHCNSSLCGSFVFDKI
uniref:Uncharacterized protein n=1 Tax=Arundo donax TaxID=35708 RepID=A0A0A9C954_ARUDO